MFIPIYEEVLQTPLTWNFNKDYLYYDNMNKPLVVTKNAWSCGIPKPFEIMFG